MTRAQAEAIAGSEIAYTLGADARVRGEAIESARSHLADELMKPYAKLEQLAAVIREKIGGCSCEGQFCEAFGCGTLRNLLAIIEC